MTGASPKDAVGVLRSPKFAELIAQDIRLKIANGELRDGDALPVETTLTKEYGVSRPTLREAFRILESEGLLIMRRGGRGGPRVQHPSSRAATNGIRMLLQLRGATFADVFAVRLIVEHPAARQFASIATLQDIADLKRLVQEQAEAALSDHPLVAAQVHELVIERAGNPLLAVLGEILEELLELENVTSSRGTSHQGFVEKRETALEAHQKFVAFVEAHDGAGAEQFWRDHLLSSATLREQNLVPIELAPTGPLSAPNRARVI
ncbi:MAG: FadR family transcriptional regulator [Acidimicrobiales bacterium]|nr:FadR family transcriptional regulator [Acidimicrobiales bacterium]